MSLIVAHDLIVAHGQEVTWRRACNMSRLAYKVGNMSLIVAQGQEVTMAQSLQHEQASSYKIGSVTVRREFT